MAPSARFRRYIRYADRLRESAQRIGKRCSGRLDENPSCRLVCRPEFDPPVMRRRSGDLVLNDDFNIRRRSLRLQIRARSFPYPAHAVAVSGRAAQPESSDRFCMYFSFVPSGSEVRAASDLSPHAPHGRGNPQRRETPDRRGNKGRQGGGTVLPDTVLTVNSARRINRYRFAQLFPARTVPNLVKSYMSFPTQITTTDSRRTNSFWFQYPEVTDVCAMLVNNLPHHYWLNPPADIRPYTGRNQLQDAEACTKPGKPPAFRSYWLTDSYQGLVMLPISVNQY